MNTQEKIEKSVILATEMTEKLNSLVNLNLTPDELSAIAEMSNKVVVLMADLRILAGSESPEENGLDELCQLCDRLHKVVSEI